MKREGENGRNVHGFILKISRKLKDSYLPVLARDEVTAVTVFSFALGVHMC